MNITIIAWAYLLFLSQPEPRDKLPLQISLGKTVCTNSRRKWACECAHFTLQAWTDHYRTQLFLLLLQPNTMQNRKIKPLSWQCMYLSRTGYEADCWIHELCLQWLKTKLLQNKKEGSMTQTGHMDWHDKIIYLSKLADSRSISSCSLIVCPEMCDIPYSAYWQPEQRHWSCYCYEITVPETNVPCRKDIEDE